MKFRVGDKVRVKDTENVRGFNKQAIGFEYYLTKEDIKNNLRHICDNRFHVNYELSDFELVEESSPINCSGTTTINPNYGCSGTTFSVAEFSNGDIIYYNPYTNQYTKNKEEIKNNNKTFMSKITTFAKNLVLSKEEKLLRKYNLHTECGEPTQEAIDLVIAKLVKENESYLVELATKMEEEESKK